MRKKLSDTFDDFEKYLEVLPQLKKDTNTAGNYRREIQIIDDGQQASLENKNIDELNSFKSKCNYDEIIENLKKQKGETSYTTKNLKNALEHYINYRKFIDGINNIWLVGSAFEVNGEYGQHSKEFINNKEWKLGPSPIPSQRTKFNEIKKDDILILKSATNTKSAPFSIASGIFIGKMHIFAIGKVENVDPVNYRLDVVWLLTFNTPLQWYGKGVVQPAIHKVDLNGNNAEVYRELLVFILKHKQNVGYYSKCPDLYAQPVLISDLENNEVYEKDKDIRDDIIEKELIDFNTGAYNKIFYGVPGCGKSYYINNVVLKSELNIQDGEDSEFVFRTIFYQDYSHADLVGQYMPKRDDGNLTYEFVPKTFTQALQKAYENPDKNIVLIIEELNRGEAASIFGDLFQLLDRNENGQSEYKINCDEIIDYLKSKGQDKYWIREVISLNKIFIPSNMYLLATMNTCDQNVFTLDTAFKRRWESEEISNELKSDSDLKDLYIPYIFNDVQNGLIKITWGTFVEEINNKIKNVIESEFFGDDRQIGCYFVKKDYLCSYNELFDGDIYKSRNKKFANKILEYLWNDVAKVNKEKWFRSDIKTLHDAISAFDHGEQVFADDLHKKLMDSNSTQTAQQENTEEVND